MSEECSATHVSSTATGEVEVRCQKSAGHVEAGDPQHEGRVGAFHIRWRDEPSIWTASA
ncbi:MAG TPA: hypothetical protein VL738_42860 [Dactylosporangium sp.]|nr:hypothetical protein [Dactylosporangium sp.]